MATHVGAALQPSTCLSVTTNNATDVFSYNDCSGPRGLTHMTGTMTVTYSVDVQGIHAHSTAASFAINQSTLDIDATATYTSSSGTKLNGVTVTISYDGTAAAHWTSGSKSGTIQLSCVS